MVGTKKQDYSLLSGHKRNEITETLSNISPYVSESKTDTGLHTVIFVSGPWILDSGFQSLLVSEIPDTLSSISDSGFRIPQANDFTDCGFWIIPLYGAKKC